MTNRKPLWDTLSDEERRSCHDRIIAYFQKERDEIIGVIAADEILDLVLEQVITSGYNKGVSDAKELLQDRFGGINIDLDMLQQKS